MVNLVAAEIYRSNIYSVFGNSVDVTIISVKNYDKDQVKDGDLFLLHNNSILKEINTQLDFPLGIPVVDIKLSFKKKEIDKLKSYPKGTRCIFASASEAFTNQGIQELYQKGVYNIEWLPMSPVKGWHPSVDFIVTPGETNSIPQEMREEYTVLDLGSRILSPSVMESIAEALDMTYIYDWQLFGIYAEQFETDTMRDKDVAEENTSINAGVETLGEVITEGVIVVNEYGRIITFNKRAERILHVPRKEAIGKVVWEFNDDLFGLVQRIPFTGEVRDRNEVIFDGKKLEIVFYPMQIRGEYRGSIIMMEEKRGREGASFRQISNLGHTAKYTFEDIIGNCLNPVKEIAGKMARVDSAVLITAETGCGKELFASAIHNASSRSSYPFVAVNCSSLPDNLLESELFGYDEGAFTGARKHGKPGLFEMANGGTLFLDEIEDMNSLMQSSLLRALQEKQIMRVGGNRLIDVDVRIIASTNIDLRKLKEKGTFRKDLYYRLSALRLTIPPLRERTEDIRMLVEDYIKKKRYSYEISREMYRLMKRIPWEGNVRQLFNALDYFACLEKTVIETSDYPYDIETREERGMNKEWLFILKKLYEAREKHLHMGRKAIAESADKEGVDLTEPQIRRILSELEEEGMVAVRKGRAGTVITEKGIESLEENRG